MHKNFDKQFNSMQNKIFGITILLYILCFSGFMGILYVGYLIAKMFA